MEHELPRLTARHGAGCDWLAPQNRNPKRWVGNNRLGPEAGAPTIGETRRAALAISGARDFLKFYRALRLTLRRGPAAIGWLRAAQRRDVMWYGGLNLAFFSGWRKHMRRRQFVTLLGSAIAAWPRAARAQQADRMRRVGVLGSRAADDAEGQARVAVFLQRLQELGWTDGRNMQVDYRWGAADADRYRTSAAELVALAPDVILASGSASVEAALQTTRTVPIVFANVIDPVGAGYVARLARPGGNVTGFTAFEYSLSGKWLELFKEIAPNLTRIAILRNPALAAGIGQFAAIQAMAPPSFGVELSPIDCVTPARSSATSLHSRASRTAA